MHGVSKTHNWYRKAQLSLTESFMHAFIHQIDSQPSKDAGDLETAPLAHVQLMYN